MHDAHDTIGLQSRVTPSPEALVQPTGDEAVLLDMASERYFGLNPVGARLWALLGEDPLLANAHTRLLNEYDVPPAQLEQDLVRVVRQLAEAGLVRVD